MYDSEEENCSLQTLVQNRKGKGIKQINSRPKLKVKIKRKAPKQIIPKFVSAKNEDNTDNPYGFERNLKAERILGVTKSSDGIMFLIKWKDSNEADLVSSKEANVNCPEAVIKFYEENIYLKNKTDKGTEWTKLSFGS